MYQHLTRQQKTSAYRAITTRFSLRHQQRTALDAAPTFRAIRAAAHNRDWATVEQLLHDAGIIFSEAAQTVCHPLNQFATVLTAAQLAEYEATKAAVQAALARVDAR